MNKVQLLKFQKVVLKFKLRFLVWLGLKMGTALGIIFVVHNVRTSSKVHLVVLRVSNDPGDSLGMDHWPWMPELRDIFLSLIYEETFKNGSNII